MLNREPQAVDLNQAALRAVLVLHQVVLSPVVLVLLQVVLSPAVIVHRSQCLGAAVPSHQVRVLAQAQAQVLQNLLQEVLSREALATHNHLEVIPLTKGLKLLTTTQEVEPKKVSCQFLSLSPGVQTDTMVRAITEPVH